MLLISTDLTFLPTTSRSRSRRRTSTSGNSSTVFSPRQRVPRRLRCCLLGSLLRRAHPRTQRFVIDRDGRVEALAVLGTGFGQHVHRRALEALCGQFLEAGLVVVAPWADGRGVDLCTEQQHDDARRGLIPSI